MSLYGKAERRNIEDHREIYEYGPQLLDIKVKYQVLICRNVKSQETIQLLDKVV